VFFCLCNFRIFRECPACKTPGTLTLTLAVSSALRRWTCLVQNTELLGHLTKPLGLVGILQHVHFHVPHVEAGILCRMTDLPVDAGRLLVAKAEYDIMPRHRRCRNVKPKLAGLDSVSADVHVDETVAYSYYHFLPPGSIVVVVIGLLVVLPPSQLRSLLSVLPPDDLLRHLDIPLIIDLYEKRHGALRCFCKHICILFFIFCQRKKHAYPDVSFVCIHQV